MKTVVVLGAGASADFGLPLGDEMYNQARDLLEEFLRALRSEARRDSFYNYSQMVAFVKSHARYKSLLPFMLEDLENGSKHISDKPISDLLDAMKVAPAYSLDTLALEYPEHADIIKVLCAQLITESLRKGFAKDENDNEIFKFNNKQIENPKKNKQELLSNWIHLFCSMMRNELAVLDTQKYGIVSFNYDRLFEKVGSFVWEHPTRNVGKFREIFDIKYPHGKIVWDTDHNGKSIFDPTCSEIVFAHNKPENYLNDGAADLVAEATKLIFLGFHFSQENITTLGLKNCKPEEVVYQNYSGNRGLDTRVSDLGFKSVRSFKGPISAAILEGELGELPS